MQSSALPHPRLPDNLQPLDTLARDLRWTFRPSLRALFSALDPELWESTGGNPVALLRRIAPERLEAAARDRDYLARLEAVRSELGMEGAPPPAPPAAPATRPGGGGDAARDRDYRARLEAVRSELGMEDDAPPAHPAARAMQQWGDRIAYFSAE